MPYSLHDMLVIAAVMTFGSVMQGALGFASGLLGVPLLVLCGFDLTEATVINFVSTGPQNAFGAVQLRHTLAVGDWLQPVLWRFVGLPLGIALLAATQHLDADLVKQIIGGVMLASILLLIALRVRPRDAIHPAVTALAFLSSGFLMGFASIGGAPMVMYVNALTWNAEKSRGFLFFCSAALVPAMGVLLAWKIGAPARPPALAALIVMPLVLAGLWCGMRLGEKLDKQLFRRLTYGLLVIVSLIAILSPLLLQKKSAPRPAATGVAPSAPHNDEQETANSENH